MDRNESGRSAVWEIFGVHADSNDSVTPPVDETLLRELHHVEDMSADRFQLAVEMLSQHASWREAYQKIVEFDCNENLNCDPTPDEP